MPKVIQNHKKSLYIIYGAIFVTILNLVLTNGAFADNPTNVNYSVTVEPALNITTSSNKVSLDLNPLNHDFDSQDLTVSVSTNNETGYKLYVNTNTTKLIEKDDNSLYIETLADEVSDDADSFTANRWGYKLNSSATNFSPFNPGVLVLSSKTIADGKNTDDITTMVFAAKVGYETKAGTYNLALDFQATANPKCNTTVEGTMQEFDPCPDLEDGTKGTLTDVRDGATYTVAKINGNWWMTQNLRFTGAELSSSASNVALTYTDTNPYRINGNTGWRDLSLGNSTSEARLHDSGNSTNGVWYNYVGATAGTITGTYNTNSAVYDICPKKWKLASDAEYSNLINASDAENLFNPVIGGAYDAGKIVNSILGYWWSATAYDNTINNALLYEPSGKNILRTGNVLSRYGGGNIRCVRSS